MATITLKQAAAWCGGSVEPQYEDMAAATISRETGAPLFPLDPIVTGPADAPLTHYEDVMRQNLAVLLEALGE